MCSDLTLWECCVKLYQANRAILSVLLGQLCHFPCTITHLARQMKRFLNPNWSDPAAVWGQSMAAVTKKQQYSTTLYHRAFKHNLFSAVEVMVSPSKAVKWLLKAKHSNWLVHFLVTHMMSCRVVSPVCSYYFYAMGDLNILLINAFVLFVILQRVTLFCPSRRVLGCSKGQKWL